MSGGSYNYLYSKNDVDLLAVRDTVKDITWVLAAVSPRAAVASMEVFAKLDAAWTLLQEADNLLGTVWEEGSLASVWKAAEWESSGDTGPENTKKMIDAFLKKHEEKGK